MRPLSGETTNSLILALQAHPILPTAKAGFLSNSPVCSRC